MWERFSTRSSRHSPSASNDTVIASHPSRINTVQLVARRTAYVTLETAHPFFKAYYDEMERRIQISLRAFYSQSPEQFLQALGNEKIDYFLFGPSDFTAEGLRKARYVKPFDKWIRRLAAHSPEAYFASKPEGVAFSSPDAVLIHVPTLREKLKSPPK